MDEEIYELLQRTYNSRVEKLGSHKSTFEVKRKRRVGIKKKFLGIFPIYEYETWCDVLTDWTYRTVNIRNNFTGRVGWSGRIAICYDEYSNICYWRYV